tara:strand:- start:1929 stop:2714 length:786 start_codon:yes stop_codon:yes gene_type:complete
MSKNKFIIAIPARLNSSRLPGKVLKLIGNKTMLYRVMENSINIKNIEETFLCTDNKSIANEAYDLSLKVILKSGNFSSGTDRIFFSNSLILKNLEFNYNINNLYIINIQADQPFIDKDLINKFIENINLMDNPEIVTAYYKKNYSLAENFDVVKLITSKKSKRVLYFSRSVIPFVKNFYKNEFYQSESISLKCHIGIYAYRFDILQSWLSLKNSQLEDNESLEQLRWLDNDIPIYAFEYDREVLSVDNNEQLDYARKLAKL